MILTIKRQRETRNTSNIPLFNVKHEFLKNTFSPTAIIEWNKLDSYIRNSESLEIFNVYKTKTE